MSVAAKSDQALEYREDWNFSKTMDFLYQQPNFKSRPVTRTSSFKVTLLLEALASGNFYASILELPTCYVEASSPESAVTQLKKNFLDRLQNIQTINWDVPTKDVNPAWMKYAGVFKNDVDFQEIMEEIHAASSSDDETEVDPSYYS